MDFHRLILTVALSFTLLLIWQAWQEDFGTNAERPQVVESASTTTGGGASSEIPGFGDTPLPEARLSEGPMMIDQPVVTSADRVVVTTDLFKAVIDTAGGELRRVDLIEYPVSIDKPDLPFRIFDDSASRVLIAQSGLLSAGGDKSPAPNHLAEYQYESDNYQLSSGSDTVVVPLTWTDDSGLRVTKSYIFTRGSYLIDVDFKVENGSQTPWQGVMYRQLQRATPPESSGSNFIYTYTGGVLYTEAEKYEKFDFDDIASGDLSREAVGGWVAMIEHYFLGSWIPDQKEANRYYTKHTPQDRFIIGSIGTPLVVSPGGLGNFTADLYIGPKLQNDLEVIAPGLELTVDYGILTLIAKPLFWLLNVIHQMVGNWGWSIIFLTILIKLAFYKLSESSYKSMAHMRKVQPKLAAIKEQFGDDKEKLNKAMMRIYKEEKINPLGGCLPILVQIPVFIALYWTLLESVEMRQAPFMFWIHDLSIADPYFVLPLLMGASMLVQQKLNPTPLDPIQARVMMVLPIVFTVFFLWFPSGLVLYWVVNNLLSISQQWYITRVVIKG